MSRRTRIAYALPLLLVATGGAAAAQSRNGPAAGACDRACLSGIADQYFAAMVAHDPAKAPLAPNARFTENTETLPVGDGLWKAASAMPSAFKIYVPDPVAGQLGAIVIMEESGKPIQLGLRIRVQNRQITEAEHLVVRNLAEGQLANLQTPRPGLLETVPPDERLPREIMLLFGQAYYDAIEQSDGDAVPFADECTRRENGMHTAGPRPGGAAPTGPPGRTAGPGLPGATAPAQSCAAQLDTRIMSYINSIDLRRVWIADEERGLVFGLSMFRHPMESNTVAIVNPDGTRGERPVTFKPFDLPAAHIFKVRDGRIHEIEALGFQMPLNSTNGWSDFLR